MAATNSEMRGTAARIDGIYELSGDRMNGIQFFLDCDLRLAPGHTIYVDSEFALTSISQQMFWKDVDIPALGDGRVRGVLSVDISEWDEPGTFNRKTAKECAPQEIASETWAQIKAHVNDDGDIQLTDDMLHSWMIDLASEVGITARDAVLPVVPMFHANAWGMPYGATLAGARQVFPGQFSADPAALADLIEQEFGIRYHTGHVWKVLVSLGWTPQRPVGKARERNEQQIQTWRKKTWPGIKKKPAGKGVRSYSSTRAE